MSYRYIEGMEKPLPDWEKRWEKRRISERALDERVARLKAKHAANKLTDAEALERNQ